VSCPIAGACSDACAKGFQTQPFQGLCEANLVTWRAVQGRRVRRDV
jgi:hypothetical protein